MKLRGILATATIALALLVAPPADAKNQAGDLFANESVSQITISISNKSASAIAKAPKTGVPGTFSISNASGTLQYKKVPIDFHLKGTSTLRQNPSLRSNRPSLRVKFRVKSALNLPFLGSMKSLTLNSMTQDASKLHEFTAYQLYNAMGVPAPRVAYAKVTIKIGQQTYDKGLFAIIEPYDDAFLQSRFPTRTQHLYEPCNHWTDVNRPGASKGGEKCVNTVFEVKEGWNKAPNKLDLRALAAIQKLQGTQWWQAMDRYTDRSEMIRMWAVENFISAWDSYSGAIINNYYLRSDSMGVFSMLPTGADESFSYNFKMDATSIGYPLIYDNFQIRSKSRGTMFTKCLGYKACRNEYLDALKATKLMTKSMKLNARIDKMASILTDAPAWGADSVKYWIATKSRDVDALLKKFGR